MGIVDQLRTRLITASDFLIGHEQSQQHGRVALECKAAPLTCRVDHHVKVAGTGAVGQSSLLVPQRASLILLEEDPWAVMIDGPSRLE
jgi:hypothetical protein